MYFSYLNLVLFGLVLLLIAIYKSSTTGKFYIRIISYEITTLIGGFFAAFATIPTYFQNRGGVWAGKVHYFFNSWVGFDVEIRGRENLEHDGQAVIISNHQSSLDIVTLDLCWPDRCTVMMKSSLKYIPGFNVAAILGNTVFVDRSNPAKAKETLKNAVKTMKQKNLKLWVFPEGTRSPQGMRDFKKGAFHIAVDAQIPIIPVVFSSYLPFYSKEKKYFHENGKIIAQVLDPISTEGLSSSDISELSNQIRNQMLQVFDKISVEAKERFERGLVNKNQ